VIAGTGVPDKARVAVLAPGVDLLRADIGIVQAAYGDDVRRQPRVRRAGVGFTKLEVRPQQREEEIQQFDVVQDIARCAL
jgi:hypothetical protein